MTGYLLTRSRSEPALLQAWHKFEGLAFLSAGAAFGAYGRFVKGFNNLWLLAPVVPFMTWQLTQRSRQPATLIDNAYRYLIAKRAATAEFEANQARLLQNQWAQSPQFASLQGALASKGETLYDLEARLVQQIETGSFTKQ